MTENITWRWEYIAREDGSKIYQAREFIEYTVEPSEHSDTVWIACHDRNELSRGELPNAMLDCERFYAILQERGPNRF